MVFYSSIKYLTGILLKLTSDLLGFALNNGNSLLCWQEKTGKVSTHSPQRQVQDWRLTLNQSSVAVNWTGLQHARYGYPMLWQRTPESSITVTQSHLVTWHSRTPFNCLFPMSQFPALLKHFKSAESLALSLGAQGWRSLIKMLNKTHLTSNLYRKLTA